MRGRFISIEGGEGVGKSTQIRRLVAFLQAKGLEVIATREPGGTAGAEAIRALLLDGAADRWGPRAEALLFAAARSDHVERLIQPALERGAWVISDRFLDSSRAYQGLGSGLGDDDVMALHRIGSAGLLPDRTLVLELPLEEAIARAAARDEDRADRIGARGADYHRRVAEAFRRFAEAEPERVRCIDASGSEDSVAARIEAAIAPLLKARS